MAGLEVNETLMKCMKEHASSSGVQEHALWGLKNMCASSPQSQAIVADKDGFALISSIMEQHKEASSVIEQAFWALRNLVDSNESNTAKFDSVIGKTKVKEFMVKHKEDPK